jgi:hypothetical protein
MGLLFPFFFFPFRGFGGSGIAHSGKVKFCLFFWFRGVKRVDRFAANRLRLAAKTIVYPETGQAYLDRGNAARAWR